MNVLYLKYNDVWIIAAQGWYLKYYAALVFGESFLKTFSFHKAF